jgi:hypothetical protein
VGKEYPAAKARPKVPEDVTGVPLTVKPVGALMPTEVTVPTNWSVELMVMVSVVALVVMLMFVPATRVRVSLFVSAETVLCPATSKFLKMFCEDPKSELVIVPVVLL